MENKYNMKGLNIVVRSNEESNFVLRLAKAAGYSWRDKKSEKGRTISPQSRTVYRDQKWPNGDFIYCFDYNLNSDLLGETEGELSCFGYDDDYQGEGGFGLLMLEYNLKVTEASELMSMGRDALELFLTVR